MRAPTEVPNYQISPVYTDESDIDISDGDPTFTTEMIRPERRNYLFADENSSSSGCSNSGQRGRKRTRDPPSWKQNKVKRMRNRGKSYISLSKTKKSVPARCLKQPCNDKCRLKCTEIISINERYEIFEKFWSLGDLSKQRAYISSCMIDIEPKYKYTNAAQPRKNNKAFYFVVNGKKTRVCKTFYKATLDVSDRMIFTVQTKFTENGFEFEELRGKHKNHKEVDPQIREAMRVHINSIPRIESHYLRASTSREYIEGSKSIKDLYNDFKAKQEQQNKEAGTYITFYKIFTGEFNISFFKPKKDCCDLCESYKNATGAQKQALEVKYQNHLKEKDLSRKEKKKDRSDLQSNKVVAVFDLQAVLQCPQGSTGSFYYLSKLNCLNLTVTVLTNDQSKVAYKDVHSYFWTEVDACRGAVDIGSCIWEFLKMTNSDGEPKEIVFYSDNCTGQNKNKYITSMYMFAVQNLNIKSITHKFLIRGHTQNEADSVHSLIEKEVKKNLTAGPIFTADQYVALIKNAKKSRPPIQVHEMTYESFVDLKVLQDSWGYNYSTDTQGKNVVWNDIKVIKVEKENPTVFYLKTSYSEQEFREVNVRNKRKKMNTITEITLQPAYHGKQRLSENKKKDLREMISKPLIPAFYAGFYERLLSN